MRGRAFCRRCGRRTPPRLKSLPLRRRALGSFSPSGTQWWPPLRLSPHLSPRRLVSCSRPRPR